MSKHNANFYNVNCFHSFATKGNESHEKVCKKKDFCRISLPNQKNNILEINQYMKSDKIS